ncbi:MAG: ATP-binding cassette domain-containing protein [Chloroflexi bacterium]|nr:ATP-binding cassette domain-containing protein [Chloroflexota bacterium]
MQVQLQHIHKQFGLVQANRDISLTVEGGMILGLLGENGAGKSTLMKVLSGFITADSGQILLDGRATHFTSPADALRAGVGMLHQDPLDFPPLRLLENFILGRDSKLGQRQAEAERDFRALCQQFGFDLDPQAFVSDLSVGERQQLEIVRLLWLGARTLILDEPTTGISAPQKVKLFATLRQLAAEGKSVIFVSHKLEDVEALCHRVAVLRQGALVGETAAPFSAAHLIQLMFGQEITVPERPSVPLGSPLLELRQLLVGDGRMQMGPLDLTIAAGEVIGLAGLEGSGQQLLMQACAGLLAPQAGEIVVEGVQLAHQPYGRFLNARVAFLPADRMAEGLVPGLTIAEHVVLTQHRRQVGAPRQWRIDWGAAKQAARSRIQAFNIKGWPETPVETLSGGNQQRVLLSLLPDPLRLVIMEHPTRGLDIESAQAIWEMLLARRKSGTAVLFSSADLDEVFQYSDRIAVCFDGQVTAVLPTSETSVEELGYLIAGKVRAEG